MIKKISLLFVGCVVAFKIIGAVEGEMITRRANTRMLIDVKHPIRSGELKQALFINQKPQLDGTIYDERPGTGTPRPIQPGRAYLFDGVNDIVRYPSSDVGTLTYTYRDIATGNYFTDTMSYNGSTGYDINPISLKIHNLKVWNATPSVSDRSAVVYDTIPATLLAWFKCDDTHATIAYDSSGNGNNGTKVNTTPATFHHTGNDVPYSWQNEVGYSGARYFSGSDSDVVNLGDLGLTEADITFAGVFNDNLDQRVLSQTSGLLTQAGSVRYNGSLLQVWSGSAWLTIASGVSTGVYYDIRILYAGGQVTATINGSVQSSVTANFDFDGVEFGLGDDFTTSGHGSPANMILTSFAIDGVEKLPAFNYSIPRNESTPANDVLGNPLQYTGESPLPGKAVQSHCGTFDGVNDYVVLPNVPDLISRTIELYFEYSAGEGQLFQITAGTRRISATINTNRNGTADFGIETGEAGVIADEIFLSMDGLVVGQVYKLVATTDANEDLSSASIDGVALTDSNGGSRAEIGSPPQHRIGTRVNGNFPYTGVLCGYVVSDFGHYPLSEGAGTTIYDVSGNDNHGTATNITEASFWGSTQDIYHYNIAGGFSLYEHATADPIYVPYDVTASPLSITTPTGYAKTYDAPSGPWHNGAESKIDFTGGVAAPGTSSWETAWIGGTARTNPLFARINGNKHDHLLAYGSVKSGAELDAIDRYTQTIVPVESMIARAGMNINDGFYHWTSGIPTNNLAKHLSWPFAGGAIDPNTLDRDLNWTFSGTVLFGLTLREGHPSGDYVITYTGPAGAVEFIGTNASVDGLTWTKSSPIEEFHVQVNASIDMTTLNIRHNSWPANETWNQQFKDYVGRFGIIRFLDWSKTNRATNTVPWQASGDHFEWADRPLPGQWSYFSNSSAAGADGLSVPVEAMVDLANAINADPWFPIHVKASDAYVLALAQYVDANLEPGLLARFERSNEVWNGQFPQKAYTLSLYDGTSVTNAFNDDAKTKYMHHKLSQAWGGIIKGVNANTNRFKMVLGIQHEAGLEYGVFDELGTTNLDEFASAPYVGGSLPGNQVDIDHPELDNILGIGTDPNQGLDYIFNVWIPNSRTNVNSFTSAKVAQIAVEHSIDYLTYEGGQHLSHSNDTVLSVLVAANRDPRMHQVYLDIISDWDTITGNAPYVFFSSTRSYIDTDTTPIFPFGHKEYEGQALSTTHKLRAIFEHFATAP